MFKKNDGEGVNALQNKFTALLKIAAHNKRIDYLKRQMKIRANEFSIEEHTYWLGEEINALQSIIDCDMVRTAFKNLSERERYVLAAHLIDDRDFGDIGRSLGLTYKGAAAIFYRSISQLRKVLGRYHHEF